MGPVPINIMILYAYTYKGNFFTGFLFPAIAPGVPDVLDLLVVVINFSLFEPNLPRTFLITQKHNTTLKNNFLKKFLKKYFYKLDFNMHSVECGRLSMKVYNQGKKMNGPSKRGII